jgi:hypothetical protein
MLIPFGILSAAGAGVEAGATYELIETKILSTATSSITFDSLATYASTYKHLQIRLAARTTNTRIEGNDVIIIRLNGDTAANYSSHYLSGNGISMGSSAQTSVTSMQRGPQVSNNYSASNVFGAGIIDLLDAYSTTKNKTIRQLGGAPPASPATESVIGLGSGSWRNTNAVTSITLLSLFAADFTSGSRFSLYGIRG